MEPIYCKELDESFETKELMFKALKKNKDRIISLKKSVVKFSEPTAIFDAKRVEETLKKLPELEDGYVYPIINTTKILDGHRDLHIDGIWTKTIEEQKGRIHYTTNHELKIGAIIAYPQDVEAYTAKLRWSDLGKNYGGSTEALIFKVRIQDYANESAVKVIDKKIPVQNSISMVYHKIELAVNSEDEDYKDEKAVYDKYYEIIANKADFKELTYFWVVKEAGIHREGSMVPLGSNQETPILYPKSVEPEESTQKEEETPAEKSLTNENLAFIRALKKIV